MGKRNQFEGMNYCTRCAVWFQPETRCNCVPQLQPAQPYPVYPYPWYPYGPYWVYPYPYWGTLNLPADGSGWVTIEGNSGTTISNADGVPCTYTGNVVTLRLLPPNT